MVWLLANLPRTVRRQLAREVLGLPPLEGGEPHHVDASKRTMVAGVDGLPSR